MRTRNSYFPNNLNVTIPRRRNRNRVPNIVKPELHTIVVPMAERTMKELLQAPTEEYGEAIVLPEINVDHFEIKTNLLQRRRRQVSNIVEPEIRTIVAPMAERTMEELLRAPTEGYGEAIVLPEINADHFEIKTNLLQLVQANPFNGHENENPHAHINSLKGYFDITI
ncbi:hypothetical protein Tco_1047166 [Tanacetum coccineum]